MKKHLLPCLFLQTLVYINNCWADSTQDTRNETVSDQKCPDSVIDSLGKHLNLESFRSPLDDNAFIISSACKQNPTNKNQIFSLVAYENEEKSEIKNIIVAVIDKNSNKILSDFQTKVEEDASQIIESDSFRIDTAPYNIAHDVRAFGIDFTSGYNFNCGDGGLGAERTLYIQDGDHLRPILTLTMSYWSFIQEGPSRCNPKADDSEPTIIENTNLSIGIGSSSTNGFKDLLISAKNSRDDGKPSKQKPFHFKLRFDGKKYPTQDLNNQFDRWQQ
jgi:hypothetical protein